MKRSLSRQDFVNFINIFFYL